MALNNPTYEHIPAAGAERYCRLFDENRWPLPPGWTRLYDADGKAYYACSMTRHTQWLHPSIPIGTPWKNNLSYGWEKDTTPDGQLYYINHVGRFTTFQPPLPDRNKAKFVSSSNTK